jgi:pre-rRNA-processing protein TSR4
VFDRLFPTPKSQAISVTKNALMAQPPTAKRTFSVDSIPLCQKCQSPRVFEFQLMPNLINVVRSTAVPSKGISEEERRRELEKEIKNKSGMEWGTCMIFCCGQDCCKTGKEEWTEEYVIVQWE